jgi:hypothetical protein
VLLVAPYDSTPATACVPAFHRHFIYAKRTEAPLVLAPMHILQLWVWERFPELRPALAMAGVLDSADVTRASRWHDVHKALDLGFAHAVYTAPKEFEWRPFGSSYWLCGHGVHDGDAAAARALLSFARRLVAGGGVGRAHTPCCPRIRTFMRCTMPLTPMLQSIRKQHISLMHDLAP